MATVLGCADLDSAPDGATVSRQGNRTIVRCVTSPLTWSLVCDGNSWTGANQRCPIGGSSFDLSFCNKNSIGSASLQARRGRG